MPVLIQIYPDRLGRRFHEETGEAAPFQRAQLLRMLVKRGMRAQLRNGNLLTGQLYVAIDFFPKANRRRLIRTRCRWNCRPSRAAWMNCSSSSDIAGKLSKVPFDEIGRDLQTTLKTLNKTLTTAEQTRSASTTTSHPRCRPR
jgi:paraquat-inducible protein B